MISTKPFETDTPRCSELGRRGLTARPRGTLGPLEGPCKPCVSPVLPLFPRIRSRSAQCRHAPHVVRQRMPQRHRPHLGQARTTNWTRPRPRANALTHSAVAARSL